MTRELEEDKQNVLSTFVQPVHDDGDQETSSHARAVSNAYMKKDAKKAQQQIAASKADPKMANQEANAASFKSARDALNVLSSQFFDWTGKLEKKHPEGGPGNQPVETELQNISAIFDATTSRVDLVVALIAKAAPAEKYGIGIAALTCQGAFKGLATSIKSAFAWSETKEGHLTNPLAALQPKIDGLAKDTSGENGEPIVHKPGEIGAMTDTALASFVDSLEKDVISGELGDHGALARIGVTVDNLVATARAKDPAIAKQKEKIVELVSRLPKIETNPDMKLQLKAAAKNLGGLLK